MVRIPNVWGALYYAIIIVVFGSPIWVVWQVFK